MLRTPRFARMSLLVLFLAYLRMMHPVGATVSWVQQPAASPLPSPVSEPEERVNEGLNQLNSLNVSLDPLKNMQWSGSGSEALSMLVKIGSDPRFQKVLIFVQQPRVRELGVQVMTHPNRKTVLWMQGSWVVVMMIVSAWWRSRKSGMLRALGIRMIMTLTMIIGLWVLIPGYVLGESYRELLSMIWKAVV